MRFEKGAKVEVAGDPDDQGFVGSWWTAVVKAGPRGGKLTVEYDELLAEDGVTKDVEAVPVSRVRPPCNDDSSSVPLARRAPGEAVDCWHEDGWWEGFVHRVYDDRITVFFQRTEEEYTDIYPQAQPSNPEAHRVRSGKDWVEGGWVWRARKAFPGAGNFRTAAAAAAAPAAAAAAARGARPAAAAPQQPAKPVAGGMLAMLASSSDEDEPLTARKAALAKTAAAVGPAAATAAARAAAARAVPAKAGMVAAAAAAKSKAAKSKAAGKPSKAPPAAVQPKAAQVSDSDSDDLPAAIRQPKAVPAKAAPPAAPAAAKPSKAPPAAAAAAKPAQVISSDSSDDDAPMASMLKPETAASPAAAAAATGAKAGKAPTAAAAATKAVPAKADMALAAAAAAAAATSVPKPAPAKAGMAQAAPAAALAAAPAKQGEAAPATAAAAKLAKQQEQEQGVQPKPQLKLPPPPQQKQKQKQQQRAAPPPQAGRSGSVPPAGVVVAANATVTDLLSSLDAGDSDEGLPAAPRKPGGIAAQPKGPSPAKPSAAAAAGPAAVAAPKQAAPPPPAAAAQPTSIMAAPPAVQPAADSKPAPTAAAKSAAPGEQQKELQQAQTTSGQLLKQKQKKQKPQQGLPPAQQQQQKEQAAAQKQQPPAQKQGQELPPAQQRQQPPAEKAAVRRQQDVQQQQQQQQQLQKVAADAVVAALGGNGKAAPAARPKQPPAAAAVLPEQLPATAAVPPKQPPATAPGVATQAAKPRQEAAAKPVQRTNNKLQDRPGSFKAAAMASGASGGLTRNGGGKAAGGGSGGGLFIIPKRPDGPTDSELVGSPRVAAASPRQQQALQPERKRRASEEVAPAAAAGAGAGGWRTKRARQEAGGGLSTTAAAAAGAAAQREALPANYDPAFPTIYCLDNLPASITTPVLREALAALGITGLKSAEVAAVQLDVGDRHSGYAVLRFASPTHAQRHYETLKSLCLITSTCPIPRPLILHRPRIREGYSWGPDPRLPGHFQQDFECNQHFAQPSSIEFDFALEWRQLEGQLAYAKRALCLEQAAELAEHLAVYVEATDKPAPEITPEKLLLPGEELQPAAGHARHAVGIGRSRATAAAAAAAAGAPASSCVWLTGVLATAVEQHLLDAFSQFGFPQKAHLVKDPVTGRPTSHAVLWMESEQRARDLAQQLQEMVYVLNGTPRAVAATVAVPGPPRGSQSVYDRALRCIFGRDDSQLSGDVRFEVVPDWLLLQQPGGGDKVAGAQRAAIALRRLLGSHGKEQDELAVEERERMKALDRRQQGHFADEKLKLGRLAKMQQAQMAPNVFLMDHLLERHGLHGVRNMRNKAASALARYADEQG